MGATMNLLELAKSIGVEGFLHCNELDKLVELAANRDVLEIGSYKGLSAWGMAISARSVTCVDPFTSATDGQRQTSAFTTLNDFYHATDRYRHIRCVVGMSNTVELAGDFDMIFIDANHAQEAVLADIRRWWPRVRKGGVFAMHDYRHRDWPGVEAAADEFFGPAPDGTVEVTLRWVNKPLSA